MKYKCLKLTKKERTLSSTEQQKFKKEKEFQEQKSRNQIKPTSQVSFIRPQSAALFNSKYDITLERITDLSFDNNQPYAL